MSPLAELLEKKGISADQLAADILDEWRRRERRRDLPSARSLGAKVGLLKKGELTWWENAKHATAREILCERLAVTWQQLVTFGDDASFRELPELPGLKPGDDPCSFGEAGWLGSWSAQEGSRVLQSGRSETTWVSCTPGSGKTLACWWWSHSRGGEAHTFATLTDCAAATFASGRVVLVEVQRAEPDRDDLALERLRSRAGLIIMASFGYPARQGFKLLTWHPSRGWRVTLTRWVLDRLGVVDGARRDQLLDVVGADDDDLALINSPSVLLDWVAQATERTTVSRLLSQELHTLDHLLRAAAPRWLAKHGNALVRDMVHKQFGDLDAPLGPESRERWASRIHRELLPGLETKARSKAKSTPRDDGDDAPSRAQALDDLEDARVLVGAPDGQLDFHPLVRAEVQRALVVDTVMKGDIAAWGVWSALDGRRDVVDRALLQVTPKSLAQRVAKAATGDDLAHIGAIEATFEALGTRMLRGWEPDDAARDVLSQIGARQAMLLLKHDIPGHTSLVALPLTRRPTHRYRDADHAEQHRAAEHREARWVAAAWTFSEFVPPPPAMDSRLARHLPHWTVGTAADILDTHLPRSMTPALIAAVRALVRRLARQGAPLANDGLDSIFVLAAVLEDVWPLPAKAVCRVAEDLAVVAASLLDPAACGRVAARIVEASRELYSQFVVAHVARSRFLVTHLTTDTFRKVLDGINLEERALEAAAQLPPRLRVVVAERAASLSEFPFVQENSARALVESLEATDPLLRLAARGYTLGYEAARRAWHLDPEEVRENLLRALRDESGRLATVLVDTVPENERVDLARRLAALTPVPTKTLSRLMNVLPRLGSVAADVYRAAYAAT